MSYEDFANKPTSRKEILCQIEPVRKLNVWTLDSGAVYKKVVEHYTINASENGIALIENTSSTLNAGEFYFDYKTFELFVRCSDDLSPDKKDLIATFRLFFSSMPYDLPFDLENGASVYYEPILRSNSSINFEIDEEQTGIALDTKTKVSFENEHGFFDPIYDRLVWENKTLKLWSWSPSIQLSEKRPIFNGIITSKTFKDTLVNFNAVDLIGQLDEPLGLSLFSASDGKLDESDLQNPKRRIYGQVKQAKTVGIDRVLDGYDLTNLISGVVDTKIINGLNFLNELSPEDEIILTIGNTEFKYRVQTVDSDIQATLSDEIEVSFSGVQVIVSPNIPYRDNNRKFHIGSGPLFEKTTTTVSMLDKARVQVVDSTQLFEDDVIKIGSELTSVRRISDSTIILNSTLTNVVPNGTTVTKPPVSRVIYKNEIPLDLIIDRDWTLTNGADVILELNNLAEFNATTQKAFVFDLVYTNGSREITTTDNVNFKTDFKSRDWIRADNINEIKWYEILEVQETKLILRENFTGTSNTYDSFIKNISYISDDTLVLVDCLGIQNSLGEWVKTASDVVKHIVRDDAEININEAAFDKSSLEIPYIISKIEPEKIGGPIREMKKVIKDINNSVLGSLHTDSNLDIVFNVIDTKKPELTQMLEDDDIINWGIKSTNKIIRKITTKYRQFVDRFTGENTTDKYEYVTPLVDLLINTKKERDEMLYLFKENEAQEMAQRIAFYNSLSTATVTVNSKLNLSLKSLNDKVWINLDRLYGRFGSSVNMKIGIINKISFDGRKTKVEFNDLGNLFNRSLNIAPDDAVNYSTASETDKLYNGHVVSDDELLPDLLDENSGFTQRLT